MWIKIDGLPESKELVCPECGSQRVEIRVDTAQNEIHVFCYPCLHLYLHADYVPRVDNT